MHIRKKYIFLLLIIVLIITLLLFVFNNKTTNSYVNKKNSNIEEKKEKIYKETEKIDKNENIENNENMTGNNKTDTTIPPVSNDSQLSQKKTYNNKEDNNNFNDSTTNDIEKNVSNDSVKETEQQTKQYIGIPSPNDFNYSFHNGKIEYNSMDSCLSASEKISLKDTSDIVNTRCMDVVDDYGTVLGEYLYINCLSGNCNKYKN